MPHVPEDSQRRRSFSRRTLFAAATALSGSAFFLARRLLRGNDDEGGSDGSSSVYGARASEPYRAPFPSGAPTLSFLALGDTGWPGPVLERVAAGMERNASALPFSFVCLLGDNFYENGVASTVDPLWDEAFERVFTGAHLDVPFRVALGNHDHCGNVQAQVEYGALDRRWRMPAQYYSFIEAAGAGCAAEFFVLDTEAIRRDDKSSPEQLLWFEDKLTRSTARWKIVIGHHPVRSNGAHGGIGRVQDAVEDLLERHGVALYLSGHDHDLQVLSSGKGFLQVVSGAGSSTRSTSWEDDTLFAAAVPGFVWVGIQGDELWLVVVDAERGPLFSQRFTHQELVARVAGVPARAEGRDARSRASYSVDDARRQRRGACVA